MKYHAGPMYLALFFALITCRPCLAQRAPGGGDAQGPPAVGERAPEFTLRDLAGAELTLGELRGGGPAALLVLRGYPGYQCPICTRQVGEFLGRAGDFAEAGARVVMIYPGPAADLDEHAREFVRGRSFPEHFTFLIDPGYTFTEAYHLRWDAPGETAYPAAFVVDGQGVVRFAKVSRSHAGRASAAEILAVLGEIRPAGAR